MSVLQMLTARLQSLNITCLDQLPKNATHTFKLRLIIVDKETSLDWSKVPLPADTVNAATTRAWIGIQEEAHRYVVRLYCTNGTL